MTHWCLCSDYADGHANRMFLFCYCFGTACGAIMFAVSTVTTISCNLARRYGPVLSLYFFDVYDDIRAIQGLTYDPSLPSFETEHLGLELKGDDLLSPKK